MKHLLLIIVVAISPQYLRADSYDLVISHGRVVDPETNFDAIRNVGVKDGIIRKISRRTLRGTKEIDATGLVVAPGFIDTHVHGQTQFGSKLMLRNGVTTTLDLEVGGINIDAWYARKREHWQTNYGIAASQEFVRMIILDGLELNKPLDAQEIGRTRAQALDKDSIPNYAVTRPNLDQVNEILRRLDEELRQGALGLGSTLGYMAKSLTTEEMFESQKLAARYGRGTFSHVRLLGNNSPPHEGTLGLAEGLVNALALNAPYLAVHDNNRGWWENEQKLALARAQGHNVWAEYYPYISGSGPVSSEFLKPESLINNFGLKYEESVMDPRTGKFLTQNEYQALAKKIPRLHGCSVYEAKRTLDDPVAKTPTHHGGQRRYADDRQKRQESYI